MAEVPAGMEAVIGVALLLLAIPFTKALIDGVRHGATHFPLSVVFTGRAERGQRRYFAVMAANVITAMVLWIVGLAVVSRAFA